MEYAEHSDANSLGKWSIWQPVSADLHDRHGTDITHPDLIKNLWMNQKEVNGKGANAGNGYQNGIDDDGNGKAVHSCSSAYQC